ncbi:hypothetical protein QBC37DRAFT_411337 [Rhypophila decipiens]|uniref:Uncharacterized protein n=1 Tax=Rhypophila decipiens TaxID=261697 RepID=A0AAN7BCA9_9PEZI|nr:hypothetical protein QBC37DRAFT_411337 [Rhypophila decipiens]
MYHIWHGHEYLSGGDGNTGPWNGGPGWPPTVGILLYLVSCIMNYAFNGGGGNGIMDQENGKKGWGMGWILVNLGYPPLWYIV